MGNDLEDVLYENLSKSVIVDGQMSGTGLRRILDDGHMMEYVRHSELSLSNDLSNLLSQWVEEYEEVYSYMARYSVYSNMYVSLVDTLDKKGIEIAKKVQAQSPLLRVFYYSSGHTKYLPL